MESPSLRDKFSQLVQGSTKKWSLGCVNSRPAARGSQEAGFMQPRDLSFAQPCNAMQQQQQLLCVVNAIFREGGKVHGPQLKNVDMRSLGIIILWREGGQCLSDT